MQPGMFRGKCPELKDTQFRGNEKLDLNKLNGQWKLFYEDKNKVQELNCISMRIKTEIEGANSTQLQISFGYKIPNQDEGEDPKPVYIYEDGFLTFNHPTQSNIGASHD